jgi:hypothetical protein
MDDIHTLIETRNSSIRVISNTFSIPLPSRRMPPESACQTHIGAKSLDRIGGAIAITLNQAASV